LIHHRTALSGALVALALATNLHAQPAFVPTIPIMEVEDLRPGMKGYGLSVFEGTEPRRFDITILGVLTNRFAGGDMIIIESHDEIMRDIGGVAGMSGSPIFVDDKLVGAFAYGWGFSVRPINGVTPIRSMLEVMKQVTVEPRLPSEEIPVSFRGWEAARHELSRTFPELPDLRFPEADLARLGLDFPASDNGLVSFAPLGTPLLTNSDSPLVLAHLERLFAGTSLRVQGGTLTGGSLGDRRNDPAFANVLPVNGGALSVIICDGDLKLAGLGTTTYVQDDRLIAYGHPMFGVGAVDAPIAVSEVVTVIPSVARPFKVGNAVRMVGALRQDRLPAVAASLTAQPPAMTPLAVRVSAPEVEFEKTFEYQLWRDRNIMPQIAFTAVLSSLEAVRFGGAMGVDLTWSIQLADGRSIRRTEFSSGEGLEALRGAMEMVMMLDTLTGNPFQALTVAALDVDMKIGDRNMMMVFDRATRRVPAVVEPGTTVALDLEYVRWRKDRVALPVRVNLPADLRPGNYVLRVMDGRERLRLEFDHRPELRRIESVDDLFRAAQPSFPGNRAYVVLIDTTERPTLNGQPLATMPSSVAQLTQSTLARTDAAGSTRSRIVLEQQIPVDGMLLGGTSVPLNVQPIKR
jgi:hypothetical protein